MYGTFDLPGIPAINYVLKVCYLLFLPCTSDVYRTQNVCHLCFVSYTSNLLSLCPAPRTGTHKTDRHKAQTQSTQTQTLRQAQSTHSCKANRHTGTRQQVEGLRPSRSPAPAAPAASRSPRPAHARPAHAHVLPVRAHAPLAHARPGPVDS